MKSKFRHQKGQKKGPQRKEINKKTKLNLVFDLDARQEFLGGFQKRKQQRKAYHKAKLEKQLANEKQRIREKAKKSVGKLSSSHSILPELEEILAAEKTETYDVGTVTVSITSLDDAIHNNVPEEPSDSEEEKSNVKQEEGNNSDADEDEKHLSNVINQVPSGGNVKTVLKRETNRLLHQSRAYKASQKMKQKNKKFKGKNRDNGRNRKDDKSTPADTKGSDYNSKRKGNRFSKTSKPSKVGKKGKTSRK